ncbi:Probable alpha-mannosidase At5g66150 [Linum perenne]
MRNPGQLTWHFVSFIVIILYVTVVDGGADQKYNTGSGIVEAKLNVHLVPHSHDDVGWLKTIDQYYVGANNSIQNACVQNVLDSVVAALLKDPNRKFVFAEMSFFYRWWEEQSRETQETVRKLVDGGQFEFVNGGWCMHDEAATHYIDMIDQTTLGHRMIKAKFNKTPRAAWQIDPFGHSAVQAYLLGAETGFDSVHFARIDYQDRAKRKNDKSLEVVWRGSKTFGSSSQIFANAFPVHYSPPTGFHFEVGDVDDLVQDDPLIYDYNVDQRVQDFVTAAKTQANVTRTNHVMWTMGDDFQYQFAESWFRQMDKLIYHVNKGGEINVLYSTPSIYTDAKNAANQSWPLKTDDYFPYADRDNAYWTGYFTSRPGFKRFVRQLSGYYLAARQLEFFVGRNRTAPNTSKLGDALGIAQHHDAVTGTAKQHTTDDWAKRLSIGATEAETTVSAALSCLVSKKTRGQCGSLDNTFSQCQLLNISYCAPTTEAGSGKPLIVVVYNPLGWNRTDIVRIPVNDSSLVVFDSSGKAIGSQYITMDNVTSNLRKFYLKAYTGISSDQVPKSWLVFQVSVPPLGWSTYFLSTAPEIAKRINSYSLKDAGVHDIVEIGPGNLKMLFSSTSGQLTRMYNNLTGVDVPIQQSYIWYASSIDEQQSSGAYIFRPDSNTPNIVARSVPIEVIRGPIVDEIHQQFSPWIYQVTRLYKDKQHAEIEYTIGPIPTDDGIGKEVVSQLTANMVTDKVFYTDSNGRDFLKRVRNGRNDWNLSVNQPVAGNYYPLNLGAYINDSKTELSVLVDRATGGGSIKDGQIELMFHRRILEDDSRGVDEALDEQVCVEDTNCQGLTVRGNYYVSINKLGSGATWRRTTGQEIYTPLLLAFAHEDDKLWKASHLTSATTMDMGYSLPFNVALITLEELEDGSVLLRLAHLYEVNQLNL